MPPRTGKGNPSHDDLRRECRKNNLPASGSKDDMIDRLKAFDLASTTSTGSGNSETTVEKCDAVLATLIDKGSNKKGMKDEVQISLEAALDMISWTSQVSKEVLR